MSDAGGPELPFPCLLELDAAQLDRAGEGAHAPALGAHAPALIERIVRQQIHGIVVRRAFPPPLVAAAVRRLEHGESGLDSAASREGAPVQLFGQTLQWAEPDLRGYVQAARQFRERCHGLFGELDYETRIRGLLGALAGGLPVEVATTRSGEPYGPSTIRCLSDGGRIPPHFENHQIDFPAYADLRDRIDTDAILSFYLMLAPPDKGGELQIHAMTLDDFVLSPSAALGRDHLEAALAPFARAEIRTGPGDLLVFDSGRFAHAVAPVAGERRRWTIGGILAYASERDRLLYWH